MAPPTRVNLAQSTATGLELPAAELSFRVDEPLQPLLAGLAGTMTREHPQEVRVSTIEVRLLAPRPVAELVHAITASQAFGPTIIVDLEEELTAHDIVTCLKAGLTGCIRSTSRVLIEAHVDAAVTRWRLAHPFDDVRPGQAPRNPRW